MRMYVRRKGYGAFPLMTEVTSIHAPKIMKTKAIFLDLDGTLLNDSREITEGNRAAIRKALDAGHKIIICTGRATVSAKKQARKLGIDGSGCYLIAFNGGVLYDIGQDCILERSAIPMDLVKTIFREAEVRKIHIQTFDDEQVIVEPRCDDEFLDRYCAKVNMDFSIIDRIDRLKQPPAKMLLIDYYDQTAEENFRKDILAKYGDRLNSFFSCKEYIEIIPKTCGKGLARSSRRPAAKAWHSAGWRRSLRSRWRTPSASGTRPTISPWWRLPVSASAWPTAFPK